MSNCDDQLVADQALDLFAEQTDASEENSKYALVGKSLVLSLGGICMVLNENLPLIINLQYQDSVIIHYCLDSGILRNFHSM